MGAMQIELPCFGGCPDWRLVGARIRYALRTVRDAAILVSGRDRVAPPAEPTGLPCNLDPNGDGDHFPAVGRVQAVLADGA
jgi:hypothetical protein